MEVGRGEEQVDGKIEEDAMVELEPKTGVSFPVKLDDGKELCSVGLGRKKLLAISFNAFAFGIYADSAKWKEHLKAKFAEAPSKPTKELYDEAINNDIGLMLRAVIVFRGVTTSIIRRGFEEELGASIKKLNGGKKSVDLVRKAMGDAKDNLKVSTGSVMEITRLPRHILQFKVNGELISKVESELMCRAYFNMYLGEEPHDGEAKERFGNLLLSLF